MLDPIWKENVQGQKRPGSWAFAEPELLNYRKPKRVVQNEKNVLKIRIIVTTYNNDCPGITETRN